jgi:hypothetical protein
MIPLENAERKSHGALEMSELHVAFSLIRMDLSDMQVIEICFPEDYPASPPTLAPSERSSDWPAAAGIESTDSDEETRCVGNRNRQQHWCHTLPHCHLCSAKRARIERACLNDQLYAHFFRIVSRDLAFPQPSALSMCQKPAR